MENPQLASECMYTKGAFGCIWYVQLYNTSGTWSYVEEERKTRWSNSLLRLPRSWSRLPLCCLDGRSLNQVDACSDCPKSTSSEMKCMLSQQQTPSFWGKGIASSLEIWSAVNSACGFQSRSWYLDWTGVCGVAHAIRPRDLVAWCCSSLSLHHPALWWWFFMQNIGLFFA